MIIMQVNHSLAQHPEVQAGEEEFLTVNMVLPATGDTVEGSASFGRLLLALSTLALERFGKARENLCPDTLREFAPSCLTGAPADPFDGRLLRCCEEGNGYPFHSIGSDLMEGLGGKGDLALTFTGWPQVSPPEVAQSQVASSP